MLPQHHNMMLHDILCHVASVVQSLYTTCVKKNEKSDSPFRPQCSCQFTSVDFDEVDRGARQLRHNLSMMVSPHTAFVPTPLSKTFRGNGSKLFLCQSRTQVQLRLRRPVLNVSPTRACTKAFERAGGKGSVRRKDDDLEASRGLYLDRRDIELGQGGSKLRGVRVQRESTLGKIGVEDEGGDGEDADEPVQVAVVVQPVGDDFRLMGRVETKVIRLCDRCCKQFTASVEGESFELWLDSGEGLGVDREAEAVEEFTGPRARVDLAPHVHDAVILGLPSKAVCGAECGGVDGLSSGILSEAGQLLPLNEGADDAGEKAVADVVGKGANVPTPSMDALLALKKKLENK